MTWLYEYSRATGELLLETNQVPSTLPDLAGIGMVLSDWRLDVSKWDPVNQTFTDWMPYTPPAPPPPAADVPLLPWVLNPGGA